MTQAEILDIRRRALHEAAQLAYDMAEQNRVSALTLHLQSNKQAAAGFNDAADQTKISAQVLDACAEEGRCIAARIHALAPVLVSDFVEGGDDGVERNPVPHNPPQIPAVPQDEGETT